MFKYLVPALFMLLISGCSSSTQVKDEAYSGNPLMEGWYADPEGVVFGDKYWIFPTFSAVYEKQVFMDAFSSSDLVKWEKHPAVIDTGIIKWAKRAMWAPCIIEKDKNYYLFFSANDIQSAERMGRTPVPGVANPMGGIGIAVAQSPGGPYKDYLGKPLLNDFYFGAQPIDQYVFKDTDGQYYLIYGGWGHCNIGKLNVDFTAIASFPDGSKVKEITPPGYVEGPTMFLRNGTYYLMWSEGNWTDESYKVAYGIAKTATGPFKKIGTILQADKTVATGAGHHSVINVHGTDEWYIVYHRRPIPNLGRDHRVTCIDKMYFDEEGMIKPVVMTFKGVAARKLP